MRTTKEISEALFDGMHELSVAVGARTVPAPELHTILENLEAAGGHNLARLLERLAAGVERSPYECGADDDDRCEPPLRARRVTGLLRKAARDAQEIMLCLEAAHVEIAGHGRRDLALTLRSA